MHTLYRKVEVNCCGNLGVLTNSGTSGNLVNLWADFKYCSQKQQSTDNTRLFSSVPNLPETHCLQ